VSVSEKFGNSFTRMELLLQIWLRVEDFLTLLELK